MNTLDPNAGLISVDSGNTKDDLIKAMPIRTTNPTDKPILNDLEAALLSKTAEVIPQLPEIKVSQETIDALLKEPTAQEIAEYEAKISGVYSRGIVVDRLKVTTEDGSSLESVGLRGYWVPLTETEITRYKLMGAVVDTKFAPKNSLHSDGSGNPVIGDVVHMVMPEWQAKMIDKLQEKMVLDKQGNPRTGLKPQEEKSFVSNTEGQGVPAQNISKTRSASARDIKDTVMSTD